MVLFAIFTPFIVFESAYVFYSGFYESFPFISSFIKFAILATIGELIGLRIRTGSYTRSGFGTVPRAVVWGFLGMTIQAAFVIFASGSTLVHNSTEHPKFAGENRVPWTFNE